MTDQPLEPEEPHPPITSGQEDTAEPRPAAASAAESSEPATGAHQPSTGAEERAAEPASTGAVRPVRRLLRARDDRVLAGVCGGLGKYLGVDPVIIRIAAVVLVFAGGAGVLLYLIGWIAIPEEPDIPGVAQAPAAPVERTSGAIALGLVFVVLGAVFLADEIWPDFLAWHYIWPVALILIGVAILLRGRQ